MMLNRKNRKKMKALKQEIVKELYDFEKKAQDGKFSYSDLEKVEELCETYIKLHEVEKIMGIKHETESIKIPY